MDDVIKVRDVPHGHVIEMVYAKGPQPSGLFFSVDGRDDEGHPVGRRAWGTEVERIGDGLKCRIAGPVDDFPQFRGEAADTSASD